MNRINTGFFPDDEGIDEFEDDGLEAVFLRDMEVGQTFCGSVDLGELKESDYGFIAYLKLINNDEDKKLIIPLPVKIQENIDGDEIIYAWKNSVLYDFIDTLYGLINGSETGKVRRYKIFADEWEDRFEATLSGISELTVEIIQNEVEIKDKSTGKKETRAYNSIKVVKCKFFET